MPKLKEVIISITNRCNLKCKMCDIPWEKTEEIDASRWKKVIKDASLIGIETVVFSGGEPLLREDIFELISFTKNNGMNACLTSNGFLINEETAYKLSQSGVDVVNISIDGTREIHDRLRGKGAFDKAIYALDNLKKYKIETTIATMISRYNYECLPYVVELAKIHGAATIKFQPFSKVFLRDEHKGNDFLIADREIEKINQSIREAVLLSSNYGILTNPDDYLDKVPLYLAKKYYNANGGCKAIETSCPINSRGEIYPCWVLTGENELIGSIKQRKFLELWGSKRHNSITEKIKKEGCPGCMMSCYDENFNEESIEKTISVNIKMFKKKKLREYISYIFKKWQKRFKFYTTYPGRLNRIFRKKRPFNMQVKEEEIESALKEIDMIKKIFKKEARP